MEKRDCHVERYEKAVDPRALRDAEVSTLAVTDMRCPNCAMRVRNALFSLSGVHHVEVELEGARAVVYWDSNALHRGQLIQAVWRASEGTPHEYRAYFVGESSR